MDYFEGVLKEQSAQDLSRYDYLWDINRLEYMVENKMIDKGFTIIISNDKRIWSAPTRKTVNDFTTRFYGVDKELRNITGKVNIEGKAGKNSPEFEIKENYLVEKKELQAFNIGVEYLYSINKIL